MAETTVIGAVTMALARAMAEDERVVILGEDVGVNGGVFRATEDLIDRFGTERVIDTPLAELAIGGVAVGMAAAGLRPVAEIQFMGFIYPIIDQIISHAARLRNRTRGRLSCPMVLRAPFGGGIHAPEHHSESTEAMFAHMPGLRVVIPSSPERAYRLLLAAIPTLLSSWSPSGSTARSSRKSPMTALPLPSMTASCCAKAGTSLWLPGAPWSRRRWPQQPPWRRKAWRPRSSTSRP